MHGIMCSRQWSLPGAPLWPQGKDQSTSLMLTPFVYFSAQVSPITTPTSTGTLPG